MSVLDRLPPGARVLVVRLRSLGDCVLSTPALGLLASFRPDLETAVMVEGAFAPVFEGNPAVAQILEPGPGIARRYRPELCLNLHGGTRSMAITAASMARFRAGFAHFRGRPLYNVRIPRAQEILGEERVVHTAEHAAAAMFFLGVERTQVPPARLFAARESAAPAPARGAYAVIHPFASAPEKTWPAAHFAEIAGRLRSDRGLEPVFIGGAGGAGDDWRPFGGFASLRGAPLGEVKSLLAGASLFLGNDSGPAHMAAAFGVPVAVIFGPSDPVVWAPWRTQSEVLTGGPSAAAVPVDAVWRALARLQVRA